MTAYRRSTVMRRCSPAGEHGTALRRLCPFALLPFDHSVALAGVFGWNDGDHEHRAVATRGVSNLRSPLT
jgi:hypothetical protein